MTTGKYIVVTMWTFVSKVMSLLFNMLSKLAIALLPKSKCLLISWLQSSPSVLLEMQKRKALAASAFPPSILHEVMGQNAMILVFNVTFKASFLTLLFHPHLKAL